MATFPAIAPIHPAPKRTAPVNSNTLLGDGYEVSLRFGLNNVRPEWQLTWETTTANATTIDDFLQARADAGEAFDWQPPDVAYALRWRCDEWTVEHLAYNWRRVNATFRQVFEIAEGDPVVTPPPPSGTPVVNNTLTAGSTCEGGVCNWYRLDPSAPGGKVFLATGATLQVAMANLGYAINYELTCPGFPPIPSDPTAPVEEWNTFTPGGEFVAYRTVIQDFTAFYTCAGVLIQDATGAVNGPSFYATRNNVVGYQLGGNTSIITYVCPPTPVDTNEVSMGISVLYADNSSEFIGGYLPNGNRGTQTGTRIEVVTFTSITIGGIEVYP